MAEAYFHLIVSDKGLVGWVTNDNNVPVVKQLPKKALETR